MSKRDYYETLGVDKNASEADIKSAFRKKAKEFHPDLNKDNPKAEESFKEAQEAYSVLSDSQKRKQYDQFGHSFNNNGASGFGGSGFSGADFDFGDIFDNLFGGSGFSGFGGSSRTRARQGSDAIMRMHLTFEEAVYGTERKIDLDVMDDCSECHGEGGFDSTTCATCNGSGQVTSEQRTILGAFLTKTTCPTCGGEGKTFKTKCKSCNGKGKIKKNKEVTVTIPSGVSTGEQLRLSGKGNPGLNGGPNGDLYIEFIVKEHEFYERDKNDIYLEVPITIVDAILGCKKEIPTIHGNVKLQVPTGTDTGDKQRIKGKGIFNSSSNRKGDMYVVFRVVTPKKVSKDEKKLLEKLEKSLVTDSFIKNFDKFTEKNEK